MTTHQTTTAQVPRIMQAIRRMTKGYLLALRLVWDASPKYTLLNAALIVANAAIAPAQVWLIKTIVDRIVAAVQGTTQGQALDWSAVLLPVAAMLAIRLIGAWIHTITDSVRELLQRRADSHARYLILQKAAQLDIAFFETPSFYDQMQSSLRESWRAHHLTLIGLHMTGELVSLGAMLGLLLQLQPAAVLVLLLTALPHAFLTSYFANKRFDLMAGLTPENRMANYLAYDLLGQPHAAKEIRLFGLDALFLQRYRRFWRQLVDEEHKLRFSQARATLLLALLSTFGLIAVWLHAVVQAVWSRITIGDLVLVFDITGRVQGGFGFLFTMAGTFYGHTLFLSNLTDFLNLPPDAVDGALVRNTGPDSQLSVPRTFHEGIAFCNVSFSYPGSDEHVLEDVSFVMRPGETVALVGENGAGKTTLVKLLARLYDPNEGTILFEGKDLRAYDLDAYRHQIGVIFQDFVRYDLSVRENIGFGQVESMDDQERVARAAELGGARAMIDELPKGFDTILGKEFEGGVDLSTGQWQKLALSRAFMRDAQILILDEPTAALDPMAEHEVFERFARLTAGKTTILVTHRLWTVRMAHRILLLDKGRLVEEGTHEELMALDRQYARMFNLQAEKYGEKGRER